mgnify:CR=1 FL=1
MALPVRSVTIPYKLATDKLELHKEFSYNSVWKTDSKAMFVDVLSIAPITSIKEVYINDVNIEDEELSLSVFNLQTGEQPSPIWEGNFPYVERTTSISKQADTYDEDSLKDTSFIRTVSSI